MIIPYEADLLTNGNILISTAYNGLIIEVDIYGNIVWQYGKSYIERTFYMNSAIVVLFSAIVIFFLSKLTSNLKFQSKKKKSIMITQFCLFGALILTCILIMSLPGKFISFLVKFVYNTFGPSLY